MGGGLQAHFTKVSQSNPLFEVEQIGMLDPRFNGEFLLVSRGGAPVVMDFDEDGWMDIYLMRWGLEDILFKNTGGWFSRVVNPLGLDPDNGGNMPVWADFDNDGDPDLFVATLQKHAYLYYDNKGGGAFVEEAELRGLALPSEDTHSGAGAAVGDINRDGYLDLIVGDWGGPTGESVRRQHYALFLNQGEANPGHFSNITQSAGIELPSGTISVFAPLMSDLDGDGWIDLPIVSDFRKSVLYFNKTNNTFLDSTEFSGVGLENNGMGTAIGDVNGDGMLDWWVTSIGYGAFENDTEFTGNRLYINQGSRRFSPLPKSRGISFGGWAWGSVLFDFDNDGDLDIALTNEKDYLPKNGGPGISLQPAPMRLWENSGTALFTDVSDEKKLNHTGNGAGMVYLDYDNDGDLDLFVVHQFENPVLFRNDEANENHWLRVKLQGTLSNRDAIGACLTLQTTEGGASQLVEYNPTNTYLAQQEPVVHFGLDASVTSVHRLRIKWPSGVIQELQDVAVDQVLTVVEEGEPEESEAPIITSHPERVIVRPGDPVNLSVTASGIPDPVFQWYRDGAAIPGATGDTYHVAAAEREDAGKYYVTATNSAGVAYSEHARVSVRSLHLDKSVARQWNEEILDAIRMDYPAPTVHSRNLFSLSVAMWDAWAAFDPTATAVPYLSAQNPEIPLDPVELEAARNAAISYAAFRVLSSRYRFSPQADTALAAFRERMELLGYDPEDLTCQGDSPVAVGNRIAADVLAFGWTDGANEAAGYADQTGYEPLNDPMIFQEPGTEVIDPNRWQPLAFDRLVLQNGLVVGEAVQQFLSPNWGWVTPFALTRASDDAIYSDPGPPPYLGDQATDEAFKAAAVEVIEYHSWHDPTDGVLIDVSPGSRHNNTLGTNDGTGYELNPVTGEPYEENIVLRADYGRILAEFWADGPDSETPPGHWNTVANTVSDHELLEKRYRGEGPVLDDLEWDVKLYFVLNAAVSDAGIACWDAKRKYDYVRPITMIRYMGGMGQSSDPEGPSYDPSGLPLKPGLIEVVTEASSAPGERHEHLADYVGEMALYTWQGVPMNPNTEIGGVGWIRAVEWMPYQRDTFVTPPFGAYTSGHSTFSRAAAEVLAEFTGSPYFPGGESSFHAKAHEFLEFESGPEQDVTLTWASYFDAADEAGISRLYGGIHVWADDLRGRIMGSQIGQSTFAKARTYYEGTATTADWENYVSEWIDAMTADPNQVADPGSYEADPYGSLAQFFFGADPDLASVLHYSFRVRMDQSLRNMQVRFLTNATLVERYWVLETSTDAVNWTTVPEELSLYYQENLGDGWVLNTLRDPEPIGPVMGARFYRVRLQAPE